MASVTKIMRFEDFPQCPICASPGDYVYQEMIDHLFNVSGTFSLRRCKNTACKTLWLDPRPCEEDIHLAYHSYFTHNSPDEPQRRGIRSNIVLSLARPFRNFVAEGSGYRKQRRSADLMYLQDVPPGKVLDVGCGDGGILESLRTAGWEVYGQDVDGVVRETLEKKEIPHFIGTLTEAQFRDGTFDAVVSNHVIEHLYNPISVLHECWRILRPGGVLVITTPNSESAALDRFGRYWAGLDAPRHLLIFSRMSLALSAREAGFLNPEVKTSDIRADSNSLLSHHYKKVEDADQPLPFRHGIANVVCERLRQYGKSLRGVTNTNAGEELVLRVFKEK